MSSSLNSFINCVLTFHPQALGQHASSIGIWQKALDTLPKQNLSPSEAAQKKQYETALAIAKTEDAKLKSSSFFDHAQSFRNMVKMPWDIANEMLPELRGQGTAGYASSVSTYGTAVANTSFILLYRHGWSLLHIRRVEDLC